MPMLWNKNCQGNFKDWKLFEVIEISLKTIPRGWTAAPMFVLIYNGRIFGDELAKLNTLNVINIRRFGYWLVDDNFFVKLFYRGH